MKIRLKIYLNRMKIYRKLLLNNRRLKKLIIKKAIKKIIKKLIKNLI